MFKNKLLKLSFIFISIPFLTTFLLYYFSFISYKEFYSILLASIYSTINFIIALISIKIANKKQGVSSIGSFLRGMILRLLVLILLIIFSFKFLDINGNNFIFSILIFYIYYLTLEIIFLVVRGI